MTTHTLDKGQVQRVTLSFLFSVLLLSPELAFANELEAAFKDGLCLIVEALTGDIGRAIATIAIILLGVGAFFGKVNWGLAVMTSVAIVAIFGSVAIAGAFSSTAGGGALSCGGGGTLSP